MSDSALKVALASRLSGRVADSGDAEYHFSLAIDNGRISLEPALVVIPDVPLRGVGREAEDARIDALIADVSTTIQLCREHKVQLTVKSGGHGASGYCVNQGGVVLDMRNLDWLQYEPATKLLRAGLGQRFGRVYDYLEMMRANVIPVGGGCPTVGLAGFLLGGGYSFLSRSYGLGCDNVKRIRVVTGDGVLRTVDSKSKGDEASLFWALQGGGGGNIGVAVEADLQCHEPNSQSMLFGNLIFPFHRLNDLLPFYNKWIAKAPKELAVYGYLGSQPDPRMPGTSGLALRFTVVFNGPFAAGVKAIQPLLELTPISVQFYNMSLPEWEELIGAGTVVNGRSAYLRSVMLPRGGMTCDVAEVFMKYMVRRPSTSSFVVWTHAGGEIAERKPEDTAFWHRNTFFVAEIKAIWDSDRPQELRTNAEWAYKFFEELAQKGQGQGAYLNYIDPLQPDWPTAYYGNNYDRLIKVTQQFDPDRVFGFQQGVGSPWRPAEPNSILDLSPLCRT